MALHRYVHGFQDRERVVDISTEGDAQLNPEQWDKLVAEVNTLLGRDGGSEDSAAGRS